MNIDVKTLNKLLAKQHSSVLKIINPTKALSHPVSRLQTDTTTLGRNLKIARGIQVLHFKACTLEIFLQMYIRRQVQECVLTPLSLRANIYIAKSLNVHQQENKLWHIYIIRQLRINKVDLYVST